MISLIACTPTGRPRFITVLTLRRARWIYTARFSALKMLKKAICQIITLQQAL